MKILRFFFLLSLFQVGCKNQKGNQIESEKPICSTAAKLEQIKFIRYHKWDGLRPNKIKFTFNFTSDNLVRLQIVDSTKKHHGSDVNFSCWKMVINDSLNAPLFTLRQENEIIEINKSKKEQVFYLDFYEMIGLTLKEMDDLIPPINNINLVNNCNSTCVSLNQDFSQIKMLYELDTKIIQKSDSINMNLDHNYGL
ncbi:hypothetical protein G3I01_14675 [Gramella sp. MT6]|uniref:hypothetical protein n=1 Tax=Gramella sp. MT6 TaxID=2705471 RepID=UPI001C607197|nr:hypothetical protein [Gramella sp. MT6]QYA26687.1 hypothetical protein G3I01_14675 [Gramella sp. MT6]